MPDRVTVYFDYLCPYAWRGAELAEIVGRELEIEFDWRHYSLFQGDHDKSDGWQLWNERIDPADENGTKGLLPFLASCAARRQGEGPFRIFRLGLLRARHQDHRPLDLATIRFVAECSGLHLPQFDDDLANPEGRTHLAHEHHRAVDADVFGTPTFVFPDGHGAYLRLRQLPGDEREAVELFRDYRDLLANYPYVETVRRPRAKRN
jgi:predicted DsbA family dithiol-disulfide isomerase